MAQPDIFATEAPTAHPAWLVTLAACDAADPKDRVAVTAAAAAHRTATIACFDEIIAGSSDAKLVCDIKEAKAGI